MVLVRRGCFFGEGFVILLVIVGDGWIYRGFFITVFWGWVYEERDLKGEDLAGGALRGFGVGDLSCVLFCVNEGSWERLILDYYLWGVFSWGGGDKEGLCLEGFLGVGLCG